MRGRKTNMPFVWYKYLWKKLKTLCHTYFVNTTVNHTRPSAQFHFKLLEGRWGKWGEGGGGGETQEGLVLNPLFQLKTPWWFSYLVPSKNLLDVSEAWCWARTWVGREARVLGCLSGQFTKKDGGGTFSFNMVSDSQKNLDLNLVPLTPLPCNALPSTPPVKSL